MRKLLRGIDYNTFCVLEARCSRKQMRKRLYEFGKVIHKKWRFSKTKIIEVNKGE